MDFPSVVQLAAGWSSVEPSPGAAGYNGTTTSMGGSPYSNGTGAGGGGDKDSQYCDDTSGHETSLYLISKILYIIVCIIGLVGNTLVIYVVIRFSKMQTVTNMYIVNLAIADECFLIGIPFLIVTMSMEFWPFGNVMCKVCVCVCGASRPLSTAIYFCFFFFAPLKYIWNISKRSEW